MKYVLFVVFIFPNICIAAREGEIATHSSSSASTEITIIVQERIETNFSYRDKQTILCLESNTRNSYRIENYKTRTSIIKNMLLNSQNCFNLSNTDFKSELQDSVIMIYATP